MDIYIFILNILSLLWSKLSPKLKVTIYSDGFYYSDETNRANTNIALGLPVLHGIKIKEKMMISDNENVYGIKNNYDCVYTFYGLMGSNKK